MYVRLFGCTGRRLTFVFQTLFFGNIVQLVPGTTGPAGCGRCDLDADDGRRAGESERDTEETCSSEHAVPSPPPQASNRGIDRFTETLEPARPATAPASASGRWTPVGTAFRPCPRFARAFRTVDGDGSRTEGDAMNTTRVTAILASTAALMLIPTSSAGAVATVQGDVQCAVGASTVHLAPPAIDFLRNSTPPPRPWNPSRVTFERATDRVPRYHRDGSRTGWHHPWDPRAQGPAQAP